MRLLTPVLLSVLLAASAAPTHAQGVLDKLKEIEKKLEGQPEPPDPLIEARKRCAAQPCRSELAAQGFKVTHKGPVYRQPEGEHWLVLMRRDEDLALCVMVREGRRQEPVELPCVAFKPDDTGN